MTEAPLLLCECGIFAGPLTVVWTDWERKLSSGTRVTRTPSGTTNQTCTHGAENSPARLSIYVLVKNEIPTYVTREAGAETRCVLSGLPLGPRPSQRSRAHMATGRHIQFIDTQTEKLNQVRGSSFVASSRK